MIKKLYSKIESLRDQPALVMFLMAVIISLINLTVGWNWNFYTLSKRDLALQLLGESHGIVLDIIILGILMVWINTVSENKKNKLQALGEIDDLRYHEGDYILVRMLRNIKTLQRLKVTKLDLHGIHLKKAIFRLYNLQDSNLSAIVCPETHFQGSILINCVLYNADVSKGDFSNADLSDVKADRANFSNSYLVNTRAKGGSFVDAIFDGAKINNTDFTGCSLANASFKDASLYKVDFRNSNGLKPYQLKNAKYVIDCTFDETVTREMERHGLIKNIESYESSLQPVLS